MNHVNHNYTHFYLFSRLVCGSSDQISPGSEARNVLQQLGSHARSRTRRLRDKALQTVGWHHQTKTSKNWQVPIFTLTDAREPDFLEICELCLLFFSRKFVWNEVVEVFFADERHAFFFLLLLQAFRRVKFHGMASLSTHSSWSSGMWQSESFISNASSDMSSLQEEEAQPYLHELINRAAPTWEHMCDKLDQVGHWYSLHGKGVGSTSLEYFQFPSRKTTSSLASVFFFFVSNKPPRWLVFGKRKDRPRGLKVLGICNETREKLFDSEITK